jgi:amino acid adenylation domain-containing protein
VRLPPEQETIRARCFHSSGTFVEFAAEDVETSILERFDKIARTYPDKLAVKMGNERLTYAALSHAADRVSRRIVSALGHGHEPVAFLFNQGIAMVGVILGILKAGKFYVPLDPSYPLRRNRFVLEDSGARIIVTDAANTSLADELSSGELQVLHYSDGEDTPHDGDVPNLASANDIAWLLYTSGTTGQPKGVIQSHRNVLHFIRSYTNSIHVCSDDRMALLRYASIFGATRDILAAILNGAGLYLFDVKKDGVASLAGGLIEEGITICFFGAPLFRSFLDTLDGRQNFPELRLIRLGSDTVKKLDVERFQARFAPGCILVNGLSSTETATVCKYFIAKESRLTGNTVPVGYPADDVEVALLDDAGTEIGPGEVGTIAIKSRYLALGYWRQPELTDAAFSRPPGGDDVRLFRMGDLGRRGPDGLLEHLGRKDFQVKIRGYRVNTTEVERVLLQLDAISDAAVVVRNDPAGDARLVACVVPATPPGPSITQLRAALQELLPEYMIPSAVITMDRLPLTPNGKLDRRALPSLAGSRPILDTPFVAPTGPVEKELSRIWQEVLDVGPIGIHDDFFALGGHSLAAMRVVSRVIERFQLQIPLQSMLRSPTIAAVAAVISAHAGKTSDE